MEDYKKVLLEIKASGEQGSKSNIFDPHFQTIISLLKQGERRSDILKYLTVIDPSLKEKNKNTLIALFRKFVLSKRVQNLVVENFYIQKATVNTSITVKNNPKIKESNKEKKNQKEEIKTPPVAKQEGMSAVKKTTDEIVTNKGELSQQDEAQDPIAKVMANFQNRKRG